MKTEQSPERLVFFSDAVVAIALTLLVLPLVDIVPELVASNGRPVDAFTEHQWQFYSFLLSFVVIGRQWLAHHKLFGQVRAYNRALLWLNLIWLLSIAALPFPTEMIGAFGTDHFTTVLYVGATLFSSAMLSAMLLLIRGNPELTAHPGGITDRWRMDSVGSTLALVVGFVLVLLVPAASYYVLLLLAVPPQIARIRYGRDG
ncbi:TMEM175 family protein [Amycolatopsis sp. GM8]|uniref:TMEM175 family protein n=1 Tax=Amycolatopsis sp. GM8 TaxID=2896530 RepID=UPI001F00D25A|nr:TMEM175 family protein [Amycolatopsis sp. GM8]